MCLKKITLANNLNKLEVVYEVPDAVYGYFDYNSDQCLQYIDEKLQQLQLDTLILNSKVIYINWQNLSEKVNKQKKD